MTHCDLMLRFEASAGPRDLMPDAISCLGLDCPLKTLHQPASRPERDEVFRDHMTSPTRHRRSGARLRWEARGAVLWLHIQTAALGRSQGRQER